MPRLPSPDHLGVQLPRSMVPESRSSLTCPSCHNKKVVQFGHHLKETVLCSSKMMHGKNKRNFQMFSPLEFIAAITQHISKQSSQLVRYYVWYSNRMRGDRKTERGMGKGEDEVACENRVIDIRNYKPKRIPQLKWRECIKKVWEVDLLTCP